MIQLNNQSLKKKLNKVLKIDWKDRNTNSDIISILNYIEENEVKIRNSYFELINIISEKKLMVLPYLNYIFISPIITYGKCL